MNIFQTTPVGIAFLKGHIGLVDFLLSQPGVDINFKNDEGKPLCFNPIALRMAKTLWSFGHSECNRVNNSL